LRHVNRGQAAPDVIEKGEGRRFISHESPAIVLSTLRGVLFYSDLQATDVFPTLS
jgi:hypothetical protein